MSFHYTSIREFTQNVLFNTLSPKLAVHFLFSKMYLHGLYKKGTFGNKELFVSINNQ